MGESMNGGEIVASVLKAQGVQYLFTLCGGHISPIFVAADRQGIRVIDVRDEANAAFCADAIGRLTGVPGVVAVTAGPGVTNTITAVKNAQLAQAPLVVLGGATATMLRGRGSLQDIDQMALIRPHVKWAARLDRVAEIVPALERAFLIAQSNVPGPVFVELAVDLLYDAQTVRSWYAKSIDKPNPTLIERIQATYIRYHLNRLFSGAPHTLSERIDGKMPHASMAQLKKARSWLSQAKRPVMVLGSQVMLQPNRVNQLVQAVEAMGIPVFLSGMARGLLGANHPIQFRHKRSLALKEADVVVLAGVPCDFRLGYGAPLRRAKVIGINRDSHDLNHNRTPNLGILADPHDVIVRLAKDWSSSPLSQWIQTLRQRNDARDQEIRSQADETVDGINPLALCIELDTHLSDDSILVGDGGDFVATASYIVQPRRPLSWLDPGVFGTLGVGAGFAMGAKLHRPDADVWLLYGDGAAGFSIMEFDSCVRQGIPIIAVVGNDAGWTQIARDQTEILGSDTATVLTHMDYHTVAEGCGAVGLLLDDIAKAPEIFERALSESRAGRPVLINAIIGKSDFRKGSISM